MRLRNVLLLLLTACCAIFVGCGKDALNDTCDEPASVAVDEAAPETATETDRGIMMAGPSPGSIDILVIGEIAYLGWESLLPGDYNVDGETNGMDIFAITSNWKKRVGVDHGVECIDGNGDGVIDGSDVFLIAVYFGRRISGYDLFDADSESGPFEGNRVNPLLIDYVGCKGTATYNFSLLDKGTWFAVAAYDAVEEEHSAHSAPAELPDVIPVSGLTWRGNDSGFEIAWLPETERPDDFDHWEVEYRFTGQPDWLVSNESYQSNTGDPDYGLVLYPQFDALNESNFSVRVRAADKLGNKCVWFELIDIGASAPPEPPDSFAYQAFDGRIRLYFNASDSADRLGYNGYRSQVQGGPYERIPEQAWERVPPILESAEDGRLNFIDTNVDNDVPYYYVIRTVDQRRVESSDGLEFEARASAMPGPPTGLYAQNGDASAMLYWTAPVDPDVDGYQVVGGATPGGPYPIIHSSDTTEVLVPDLTNETTYYFRARAHDEWGVWSDYSEEIEVHPSAPPDPVTGLTGVGRYLDTEVYLSWDEVQGPDLGGLDIRQSLTSGGPVWDQVGYIVPDLTEYTLEDITRASTYYYKMRVIDEWGVPSEWSGEIAVTTPDWQWEIVDQGGNQGDYSSICIGEDGYPIAAYYDLLNQKAKCAMFNGLDWDIHVVNTTDDCGRGTSVGLMSNGDPAVSYIDDTDDTLHIDYWSGTNWSNFTINDEDGPFYNYTSMDKDSSGLIGVAACAAGGGNQYYRQHKRGTAWPRPNIDSEGDGYFEANLKYDPWDNPAISLRGWTSETLRLIRWDGATWTTEVVASGGDIGRVSSLAFDYQGNPVIAHGDTALMLEWFNGTSWEQTIVDDTASCRWPSLVLQDGRIPIISYHHHDEADLFLAWYKGDTWEVEELRTGSGSCSYTGITLDPIGNPVISLSYFYGGPESLAVCWFK